MAISTSESRFSSRVLFEGGLKVLVALLLVLVLLVSLDWLLQSDTYKVEQLQFEGNFSQVTETQLEDIVLPVVQGNYLMLDLDRIRAAIESLPWVRKAWVRRSWPNGIHIRFREERPVAFWGRQGSLGEGGHIIPASDIAVMNGLPRLGGPEGSSRTVLGAYQRFAQILQKAGLQISSLQLTSRHGWRIIVNTGTEIVLDQDRGEQKLERLAHVYRHIDGTPARIDLRYTNGFAVMPANRADTRTDNLK